MGVDTDIYLPPTVRVKDVAKILGILAGCKAEQEPSDHAPGHWYCRVPDATVEQACAGIVEMAMIRWTKGGIYRPAGDISFHFESSHPRGARLIIMRSWAWNIAAGRRLVNFFGGSIVYSDCNGKVNYSKPWKSKNIVAPSDGEPYWDFQKKLYAMNAIMENELIECDKWASYKLEDMDEEELRNLVTPDIAR